MRNLLAAATIAALTIVSPILAQITIASGVTVAPGEFASMPVTLASPAPSGGVFVNLSTTDPTKVTINPASVYIPTGATTPFAQPQIKGVNFGAANIAASAFGLTGDTETVRVAATLFGPTHTTLARGATQSITFTLSAPAPSAIVLKVVSDAPAIASAPAHVTIPAQATTAIVPISGMAAGSAVIRIGSPPNIAERALNVTVVAVGSITLSNVTAPLGRSVPFPITLGSPAPTGGVLLSVATSNKNVVAVSASSLFIPAGSTSPASPPQVTGVNIGVATITVSASGYATASQAVPVPATISFSPTTLSIPRSVTTGKLLLALSDSAPWGPESSPWAHGLTVQLSSSNPNVATVQPSADFYPDGSSFTTVVIVVNAVSPGTAVIKASAPPFIPETTATVIVGGSGSGSPTITATGGTPQSAAVNTIFAASLVATVKDSNGNATPGVLVTFTPPLSGAGGAFEGGVNTGTTNAAGVAQSAPFRANATPGTYIVSASAPGVTSTAAFVLTNTTTGSGAIVLPGNITIGPSQSTSFAVNLTTPAPPSGITISLSSSDASKIVVSASTVVVAGGATTPTLQPQVRGVNFGTATINAVAAGYASGVGHVQVSASLKFSPADVTFNGSGAQTLLLVLSAPAPAQGLTISLKSSNPAAATVTPSVVLGPGATSASIPIVTAAAGSTVITATSVVANVTGATATVTVRAASQISLPSGVTVAPGEFASMPVTLASPAPSGGVFVNLSTTDPAKVTINPASVYIPTGATTPFAQPQIKGVNFGAANIAASAFGLTGDTETVRVAATLFGPTHTTLARGATQSITFTLSAPAPSAIVLKVVSDAPAIASAPAHVTIPAQATTAIVPISGMAAGSAVIRIGSPPNIAERALNVTVVAVGSITLSNVTAPLGRSVPFPITLGSPAPTGGVLLSVATSNKNVVAVSASSLFIPAGSTSPASPPQVTGVNIGVATITVSASGYATASQAVPVPATISFSPTTLSIPRSVTTGKLLLALSDSAPWGPESSPWAHGLTVQLSSSNPNVATVQPSADFYPDGSSFTTVVIVVNAVSPGTAVIKASAPPFIPETTATVNVLP